MSKRKEKLRAVSVPIRNLSLQQVLNMYDLFCKYYDNVDQSVFMKDMSEKERVFLLKEKDSGNVVGFSTLKRIDFDVDGKPAIGLFSGDTVLDKRYWGSRALHVGMFKYMLSLKVQKPLTNVYWLLISKGYKTYLLLTNNFPVHYPRFDTFASDKITKTSEQLKFVVAEYCMQLFPKAFDRETMLLDFGNEYQHLRDNIAEITPEMRANCEKIDFFERTNPNWRSGVELPCVGEISFHMLASFVVKMLNRSRQQRKSKQQTSTPSAVQAKTVEETFAQPKQV